MSPPTMCTQCGERKAVVELTQIVKDQVAHLHLCDRCAAEKGIRRQPLSGPEAMP